MNNLLLPALRWLAGHGIPPTVPLVALSMVAGAALAAAVLLTAKAKKEG